VERQDGRKPEELRKVEVDLEFLKKPGTVLYRQGDTVVLVSASIQNSVPPFLTGTGTGWITAEYNMLPGSTQERMLRERAKVSGRTYEIQRLIGRSLRAGFFLNELGERTIWVDCDVLQADGGTRTASITAGFIAVYDLLRHLKEKGEIERIPLRNFIASVSAGIVEGELLLDLTYEEDSRAWVDLNLVMTDDGKLVEIQGTGEATSFSKEELDHMLELGWKGIRELIEIQKTILGVEG